MREREVAMYTHSSVLFKVTAKDVPTSFKMHFVQKEPIGSSGKPLGSWLQSLSSLIINVVIMTSR